MLTNENATLLSEIGVEHPETVSEFRMMRDTLNDLLNAVRREERERAIAVLRPFAEAYDFWNGQEGGVHPDSEIDDQGRLKIGHLLAASSYISHAQGADQ